MPNGIAAPGDIDLSATAAAVCDPRGLHQHRYHRWTDQQVSIGFTATDPGYQLRLNFGPGRTPLWSQPLPPKIRRRGVAAVGNWAHTVVAAWLDGLDHEIADTHARAQAARRRADEARAAAVSADTAEPAELTAARTELDRINHAIRAELSDYAGQPPAAA